MLPGQFAEASEVRKIGRSGRMSPTATGSIYANASFLSIQQLAEAGVDRWREPELGQVVGQVQLDRDNLRHRAFLPSLMVRFAARTFAG